MEDNFFTRTHKKISKKKPGRDKTVLNFLFLFEISTQAEMQLLYPWPESQSQIPRSVLGG